MKILIKNGHKTKSGWVVAQIKLEVREISFWIPRRDMREETSYFFKARGGKSRIW